MNLLLKEYILSGDRGEAERCLRDLEVPHFHHEFVYEVNISASARVQDKLFYTEVRAAGWWCEGVRSVENISAVPGHRDGVGVQRREDVQNGSAAPQITGHLLRYHCGPNQKGTVPSCV